MFIYSLLFLFFELSIAQPPFGPFGPPMGGFGGPPPGPFGGPPPWRRPPWARRPPWMRPPWARGPWGLPPPMPPPMEEEVEEIIVTEPPNIPPPVPPPGYTQQVQTMVSSMNSHTSAFMRPGEDYGSVINLMKDYYTRKSGIQYDMSKISISSTGRNELSANKNIIGALYETDMMLTLPQMQRISANGRVKRKINANMTERWTITNIPYRFDETDATWQSQIRSALNLYAANTCIRFTENGQGNDYILFSRGEGCYSGVGRLGGAQQISIGYGCETDGIIAHEVGHSLGLWHEQARPERDSYVRLMRQNIIRGTEGQFEKKTTAESTDYGVSYDYGSVMHYASNAFSTSFAQNTLEPVDKSYLHTMGNRVAPSFLDYKAINLAFCGAYCRNSLPCQNGGYPDPNNCGRCKCPVGLQGVYCNELQYSGCGTALPDATSAWRNLSYSGSSDCYWQIQTTPGNKIRFELTTVTFKCAPACEEFIEIKYDSFDKTGVRLCCRAEFGEIVSKSNKILIITKASAASQFTIRYKAEILVAPRGPPATAPPVRVTASPRPVNTGIWSLWSQWSGCTELCGACGTRRRIRTCSSGRCSGFTEQNQVCNTHACQQGTTLKANPRGKRSVLQELVRSKRAGPWCCSGFRLSRGACVRA